MTDEQQVRDLLTRAAELPDRVQPPVSRLLEQGHKRRLARRAALAGSTTGIAAIAAAVLVLLIPTTPAGRFTPSHVNLSPSFFAGQPGPGEAGPTATQISRYVWASLSPSPLGARSQPILAWTGSELLEIGGLTGGKDHSDGAIYNLGPGGWVPPATWRRIARAPGVVDASTGSSVWTGHELFVIGGHTSASGVLVAPWAGLYNPTKNRWTATSLPTEIAGLNSIALAWTGSEVIVAGTNITSQQLGVAAYNPVTNGWQVITPSLPSDHPARFVSLVATSDRLILWSQWDRVKTYSNGASDYAGVDVLAVGQDGTWRDATGSWPQMQNVTSPIFTGSSILLSPGQTWCGAICSPPLGLGSPGYLADPLTLQRTALPLGPIGQADPALIWTGRDIIAVNMNTDIGSHNGRPAIRPDDMAILDPAAARWTRLPAPPGHPPLAATPVWADTSVWADTRLLALASNGQLLSFMHNCC